MPQCDAVFEGGGVKGIAFVGAIQETEARGYRFQRLAGTSAGSMVAALLAAGYNGEDLEQLLGEVSFASFLKQQGLGRLPLIGKAINVVRYAGMYNIKELYQWMDRMLSAKGVRQFGDLEQDKLKIIVSDLTYARMMILPDDLARYGINPRKFPIAMAVAMSCAIPLFFQPVILQGTGHSRIFVVDGGLLSNFPVWIFDSDQPRWPTFGYKLKVKGEDQPNVIRGPISLVKALVNTMLEAHDRLRLEEGDAVRTIVIPIEGIKATQFHLDDNKKKELVQLGREEAKRFFNQWSFSTYLSRHRFIKS
jgi:NTE family protein